MKSIGVSFIFDSYICTDIRLLKPAIYGYHHTYHSLCVVSLFGKLQRVEEEQHHVRVTTKATNCKATVKIVHSFKLMGEE